MAKKEVDIKSYYQPSEVCTAQHIMYKNFIESSKWKGLPKVIFYILLNEEYGLPIHKDEDGHLGYKLNLLPSPPKE